MDTNGKMDPNLIAGDASAPEHVVLTFFFFERYSQFVHYGLVLDSC